MNFLLFLLPAFGLVFIIGCFKYINLLQESQRQYKEIKQLNKQIAAFDGTIKQFGDDYQLKFQRLLKIKESEGNTSLTNIKPLVNNFSAIMLDTIKYRTDVTTNIKTIYERSEPGSYDLLLRYLGEHSEKAKQLWRKKGLIAIIEILDYILADNKVYSDQEYLNERISN